MPDDPATELVHAGLDRAEGSPSAPPIVTGRSSRLPATRRRRAYSYTRRATRPGRRSRPRSGRSRTRRRSSSPRVRRRAWRSCSRWPRAASGSCSRRTATTGCGRWPGCSRGGSWSRCRSTSRISTRWQEAVAAPSVLWAETPTNPLLRVADLDALGRIATAADAPLVVDNTVATAVLQRPLEHGATATLTSLTKVASGHSRPPARGGGDAGRGARRARCGPGATPVAGSRGRSRRGSRTAAFGRSRSGSSASRRTPSRSRDTWRPTSASGLSTTRVSTGPATRSRRARCAAASGHSSRSSSTATRRRPRRSCARRASSARARASAASSPRGNAEPAGRARPHRRASSASRLGIEAESDLVADLDAALAS